LFAVSLAVAATSLAADYFPPAESAAGWRSLVTVNIEPDPAAKREIQANAGLDWDLLANAWNYAASFEGIHSVVVIRHGWIAAEWRNFDEPRGIASCTKSLTGMALARLFDQGRLKPDDPAWKYLPAEWASAEPARKRVRIRDMMTMSSGLDPYDGPYRDQAAYAELIMNRKVEAPPGKVWCYNSAPIDQMSLIVERASGAKMGGFFQREIGTPIDLGEFEWPEFMGHTGGSGGPGGGARLTSRQLARIGYLLLHQGNWNGKQVLSQKQVALLHQWNPRLAAATFRQPNFWVTQPGSQNYYGHLFWTNRTGEALGPQVPRDTFYMSGFGMQACWIIPSLDMVIVRLGSNRTLNSHIEFYREFLARILAAIR
jgi:CubicO group peptidase (beta-lactamase class C family)